MAKTWTRWSPPDGHIYVSREPSRLRLRCDLRDELARIVYYRGTVNPTLERWVKSWLNPGDLYVDVGAHIGYLVSLAAKAVGLSGAIIAFEPFPATRAKLEQAVTESGRTNITVRAEAVSASAGIAEILAPVGPWAYQSYRSSLVPALGLGAGTCVPTVALDDVIGRDQRRIRLLKIDVEGQELAVLRGARRLLSHQWCDAILMELNPGALAGANTTVAALVAEMAKSGYEPFTLDRGATPRRWQPVVPEDEFADAIFLRR